MKVLVTGATGFIGAPLSRHLANSKHDVHALFRNENLLGAIDHTRIQPCKGDVTCIASLLTAMQGCDSCIHLAAIAKPWMKERTQFENVNVAGTRNVFEAALKSNVRRVVFTSTAGVFGPAAKSNPTTEPSPTERRLDSDYERSKQACETVVREYQARGLDIVTLYPTRVFGPGNLSQSNALTDIFRKFNNGKWRIVPGNGKAIGNYVYVDDVVESHVRALRADCNERFLVAGENLSFHEIVDFLRVETGKQQAMIHVPGPVLLAFAQVQLFKATLTGSPPTITPAFARKYLKDWYVDGSKIQRDLGIVPTKFATGLKLTLDWIRDHQREFVTSNQSSG